MSRKALGWMLASAAAAQDLERAKRAFDAGDHAEAARLFEAEHQRTQRCDVLFYLGLARHRMGRGDDAIVAFQSAGQCDPKLVPAHLALAEAYLERANEAGALTALLRVLEAEPAHTDALHAAASIYLRNQRNDQAAPLLERLVAAAPSNVRAKIDLAAASAALGNTARAKSLYANALVSEPANASALMGLANLHLKDGEETAAVELLERAAAAAPRAYEPRVLLGTARNRQGRFDDAIRALLRAIELGGAESAEVHYHLARAYGGADRADDRRASLARFAELTRKTKQSTEDHRQAQRLTQEAAELVAQSDLVGALRKMEESRALRPGDPATLFRLASLHYDLREDAPAREYAAEAVQIAPSEWPSHLLLGLIERRAGRMAAARRHLGTAIAVNANAAEAHNALGSIQLLDGEAAEAVASFERAVRADPSQRAYQLNLEYARKQVKPAAR